jgi:hypothetical protein
MIPSNYTLEAMTRARMEDRASEAAQRRLVREVSQGGRRPAPIYTASADIFCWLRQLASRATGAAA